MAHGHRHAPARLVHSLRLLAKAFLVDVGDGRRCRRDGRLHDLGGAAHELGFLMCRGLGVVISGPRGSGGGDEGWTGS
eukprot:scaffold64141_cov68-Phaeocystis_antarctica.AAC.8